MALSALSRQGFEERRIGDLDTLQREIGARATDVNQRQRGVGWQMAIDDARSKLKSVLPKILS